MGNTLWDIQEMACCGLFTLFVCSVDQSLKSNDIIRICKVDDVDRNIIFLQSESNIFKVFLRSFFDWMSNKNNDSLPLRFVLSVLKRKLGHFHRREDISPAINMNVID